MKMKKILITMVAVLLLIGCGDSTSADGTGVDSTKTETSKTEDVNVQKEAEYLGVFGEDVFYNNINDCVGCEFDITMIYNATDAEGKYVFSATEKTAEGTSTDDFRVTDKTEDKALAELENYSITDHLAVQMRVVLNDIKYYEYDDSGDITVEYEVSAKEATFLPLDSIETKLARNGYFVAGNMINFKNGLSIYIAETGYLNNNGISCAYVKVEATNNGTEEVYMPNPDFYGDDYVLERSYLANDSDVNNGMRLAPGRKVQGYYCAKAGNSDYSVVEADLSGAIVMIQYTKSDMDDISIYGTYSYDNGVDAVVEGEVSIATDTEENCIYLAALFYDSNHYSAEVYGFMQMISENTFSVKDEITGAVELEVTFVDGGMDVKVTATESDEYKVLEGHYDMTSQLNFNEVG